MNKCKKKKKKKKKKLACSRIFFFFFFFFPEKKNKLVFFWVATLERKLWPCWPRGQSNLCPPPPSGFLQPPVRRVEDLGLVEACDRSVPFQWVHPSNSFQDRDQSVDSPVCSEGRLDGIHRPEGCIPSWSLCIRTAVASCSLW